MADFGPNSTAVARFVERIRLLEEGDALALAAASKADDEGARHRATDVGAIVVGDLMEPAEFEALYGPWRAVEEGTPQR